MFYVGDRPHHRKEGHPDKHSRLDADAPPHSHQSLAHTTFPPSLRERTPHASTDSATKRSPRPGLTPSRGPLDLFGSEVRRYRQMAGLSLAQLADQIPFAASTIGEAEVLRIYEPLVITGLLQTPNTAEVLLYGNKEKIDGRLKRQAILVREDPPPPRLVYVLPERVLRSRVGTAAVMYEQLLHLAGAVSPFITVQVIPDGEPHPGNSDLKR